MDINDNKYINIHSHQSDRDCKIVVINRFPGDKFPIPQGEHIRFSVGIHPWHLQDTDSQMTALVRMLSDRDVIAIGECGLDKFSDFPMNIQLEIFHAQVGLSEKYHKPMIIHCVRNFNEIIKIRKQTKPQMPWILHGYNANEHITRECIRQGFYFSLGEHLFNQSSHAYRQVRSIPASLIFLETDESNYAVSEIYRQYSQISETPLAILQESILTNFNAIFD